MPVPNCPECNTQMKKRKRRSDGTPFWGCPNFFTTDKCRGYLPYNQEDLEFEVKPKKEFTPSPYQEAIFDWVKNGKGNAFVEAVAGSGKTVTLLECLNYIEGDAVFLAFNRHIAKELGSRAPAGVKVATIHSIGFQAINEHFEEKPIVNDKKVLNIIDEFINEQQYTIKKYNAIKDTLRRLIPLVKATMANPRSKKRMTELCERYSIETNGHFNEAYPFISKIIRKCKEITTVIDFDDMIWLPVKLELKLPKYDWVFVDESQDVNACQMEIIRKLKRRSGRIVCVGDRRQSIYGFRGADAQAVPKLIDMFKAHTLPLSICYRCPKVIVEEAKKIVPQIECWDQAIEGEIVDMMQDKAVEIMESGDMVMCRINAPLIPLAYRLIKMDKKVVIRGRDIGKGLIILIDKLKASDIKELITKIEDYKFKECLKLSGDDKKQNQLQAIEDKCDTLIALTEGIDTLTELKSRIESIFSDDVQGIVLSSVHRAKGLETDNTYILMPELLPFPKAVTPDDIQQEYNLKYVSITRAKKRMVYIK